MFAALFGTLGFSVLAGILVGVMVTPALAVTGATVNSTIGIFDSLPGFIAIDTQPQQNRIFATKDGEPYQIATIFDQNREEVTWEQVSDFAKDAAVSGEDKRFYEHGGVDPQGIARALVTNVAAGGIAEGASTITQQYVKNTFIQAAEALPDEAERKAAYEAAVDTDYARKLQEMRLAISLEKEYSKQEILLAYLNIASFGGVTYGIEAAAQRYYQTTAANLTVSQAASLVGIVQSPGAHRLDNPENFAANQVRRDVIVNSMYADGKITVEQRDEAIATPIDETTVVISDPRNGCLSADKYTKFFCDYVTKVVKDLPSLGADEAERAANFKRGGYDFYTTLDLGLQTVAQKANWDIVPNDEKGIKLGSASVSVEAGTGRIITMAQNKLYNNTDSGAANNNTAVNFNTDLLYGGSGGFQPGSTYKVFTLLNWLQNGHGINEVVNASGRTEQQSSFTASCSDGYSNVFKFRNDLASEGGNMTVARGVQSSVNGVFVSMALKLDLCGIRDTAASIGVHPAKGGELDPRPSSVLGSATEVAPMTMAAAYAAIAAGGTYCKPIAIDRIVDPSGVEIDGQPQDCTKQIDTDVANTAAFAMRAPLERGTATASNPGNGVTYIGKTGTTDESIHTWMVGSSTKVATAVWVGNISGKVPMRSYTTSKGGYAAALRHSVFRTIVTAIDKTDYRGGDFPGAAQSLLNGSGKKVPDLNGQSVDYARTVLEGLGFKVKDGGEVTAGGEQGKIARTDPSSGALVSKGTEITVFTSDGQLTSMPDVVGGGTTSPEDGRAMLMGQGFNTIAEDVCRVLPAGQEGRDGTVVATNPAAGASLQYDNRVTLVIGRTSC